MKYEITSHNFCKIMQTKRETVNKKEATKIIMNIY